jgi:hypothetical protein
MGLSYVIDSGRRQVRSHGWGVLTAGDIQAFYVGLGQDPAFAADYRHLCDLREVTEVAADSSGLAVAAQAPIFTPGTRRALVASRDAVYGMARAYAAYNERMGQTVRVFRAMDAAELWIDSPE